MGGHGGPAALIYAAASKMQSCMLAFAERLSSVLAIGQFTQVDVPMYCAVLCRVDVLKFKREDPCIVFRLFDLCR